MEMVSVSEMLIHLSHLMAAVKVGSIEFFAKKSSRHEPLSAMFQKGDTIIITLD